MQPWLVVFLALLFAHILGDFPLQSRRMVDAKLAFRASAYSRHLLVHFGLAAGALALFTTAPLLQISTLGALALLTLGHGALDLGKSAMIHRRPSLDRLPLFAADQFAHVVIVAAAALIVVQDVPAIDSLRDFWVQQREALLVVLVILSASVFPAGYLIRYLLVPLSRELAESASERGDARGPIEELTNAGLYLGWLERTLLVVAFAAGSLTAVGLIMGAKSIARFPEFKSRAFAEYFLIGTLASVTVAAVGGWALKTALVAMTN